MNAYTRTAMLALGFALLLGGLLVAEPLVPNEAPIPARTQAEQSGRAGFVAPQIDLSHLDVQRSPDGLATVAPERWDWRAEGKVTSVKNQGACGACYSFASLANIESKMLIDGAGTFDFSENNAKECNWYGTSCAGGNNNKMANLFTKTGTVLESCDPYVAADVACSTGCANIKTLLDWRVISGDEVPSTTLLQDYIYENGPVYTTFYCGDGSDTGWETEFNAYDGSYVLYYTGDYTINHAVCIVGWDDTLSHAGGQGAWIVKNSWGTGWGGTCRYGSEGGYFMIAYGSANIGKWSSYAYNWQDYDGDGDIMYKDEGGWTSSWGFGSNTTCWGLSKFVPTENTYLTRVELWTNDATSDIDVYVYNDFNGLSVSDALASKLNSSFTEAGYHSIALTTPLALTLGDDIYVVVQVTNAVATYPMVGDGLGSCESTSSYISADGQNNSWYDLGLNQSDDVGIRVRTSSAVAIDDETALSLPKSPNLIRNYPNPFNSSTTIEYSLPRAAHVTIQVYDLMGSRVELLVNEYHQAGYHQTSWNPQDMPSGYYFYKLQAGRTVETQRMLLLK
ncbi:MAG: T9SS type A sorting domain-containing protein [candidate division Zixibacteria bacterium]|nr:T9SS type A sorting domain-containing protein [candidate division Zixibacteria bacterium]